MRNNKRRRRKRRKKKEKQYVGQMLFFLEGIVFGLFFGVIIVFCCDGVLGLASCFVCCSGNRTEFVGISWTKPTSRRATCMLSTCMHTSCIGRKGNVSWNRADAVVIVVIVAAVAAVVFRMFQQHPTAFTGGVAAWQGTGDEMPTFPTRQPREHGEVEFPHVCFYFLNCSCFGSCSTIFYILLLYAFLFSCFLVFCFICSRIGIKQNKMPTI